MIRKLNLLGFDTLDARTLSELKWERDDVVLLRWARKHRRILLSLDLYKKTTGMAMNDEIRAHNGRVLTIAGGPQQPVHRALGKLLFYQDQWEPFFAEGHGRVEIHSVAASTRDEAAKPKLLRPWQLPKLETRDVRQGERYLHQREQKRKQPPTRVRPVKQPGREDQPGLRRVGNGIMNGIE